jgi:hypothetical protein
MQLESLQASKGLSTGDGGDEVGNLEWVQVPPPLGC